MSSADTLRVIPLGGLGEVGMNCMALEHDGQLLVIDCGTSFPGEDHGVDVLHADLSWLTDNWSRVCGVFLTHGHEDHIGALPFLLKGRPLQVFGPRHALRLVQRRFSEQGTDISTYLRPVKCGERIAVGPFEVEPIRVSHSIVEATALAISCAAGRVVHSGDFKFDERPSDGEPTDEQRLLELGVAGVDLLLSDSTNVDSVGTSASEADVADALDSIVKDAPRRVFVALFASNVQRLISLGRIAQRRGRRLCLLGRSLALHVEVATELGYLDWPHDLILPPERAKTYPKDQLLVLATGTQAEPGAAMSRLARGDHRFVDVEADDTVVFSSRIIPGCDRQVVDMMCALMRRGARVESRWTSLVHASGHAHRGEQRRLIELLTPRCFVPVHGTLHHLSRHAALARQCGVPEVLAVENGQTVVLENGTLRRGQDVPVGRIHVAIGGHEMPPEALDRRRDLARCGVLSVAVVCDHKGRLACPPTIQALGLPRLERREALAQLADYLTQNWGSLRSSSSAPPTRNGSSPDGDLSSPRSGRGYRDRTSALGLRFVSVQTEALPVLVERSVQRWVDAGFGLRPLVAVHIHQAPTDG